MDALYVELWDAIEARGRTAAIELNQKFHDRLSYLSLRHRLEQLERGGYITAELVGRYRYYRTARLTQEQANKLAAARAMARDAARRGQA